MLFHMVQQWLDVSGFLKINTMQMTTFRNTKHAGGKRIQLNRRLGLYKYSSPVVKPTTICLILSHVVSSQWQIKQVDINNAFLKGDLQKNVYMHQPPDVHLVCKLHKAIYGLKQTPRSWFQELSTTLHSIGFNSTKSDVSLFVKFWDNSSLFVLVYVDDIIITWSSPHHINTLISMLRAKFPLKDLVQHYFLGIEASTTTDGSLHLSQTRYICDLLKTHQRVLVQSSTNANDLQLKVNKKCFLCCSRSEIVQIGRWCSAIYAYH